MSSCTVNFSDTVCMEGELDINHHNKREVTVIFETSGEVSGIVRNLKGGQCNLPFFLFFPLLFFHIFFTMFSYFHLCVMFFLFLSLN